MTTRRPPCTCLTHDDLCPSCAEWGKAQANHQRRLDRVAAPDFARPRGRRRAAPAPKLTPAQRFAAAHQLTTEEAARFLAQQAAARAERQWWAQWEVR